MIATLSGEEENLGETISTCRFAQRVACITNTVKRNEEIDDKALIRQLRRRVHQLEAELAMLRAGQGVEDYSNMEDSKLTDEEKVACARIVQEFLVGRVHDPILAGISSTSKFRECLKILKSIVSEKNAHNAGSLCGEGRPVNGMVHTVEQMAGAKVAAMNSSQDTPTSANNEPGMAARKSQKEAGSKQPGPATVDQVDGIGRPQSSTHAKPASSQQAEHRGRPSSSRGQQGRETGSFRPHPRRSASADPKAKSDTALLKSKPVYKSPYQRKQEKEIQHLHTQVKRVSQEQTQERRHLVEVQADIQEQQLVLVRTELRKKLEGLREQLAAQQNYVVKLREAGADSELLQQEKLVERQLRKKQAKVEKRLEWCEGQLEDFKSHHQGAKTTTMENVAKLEISKSVEDAFKKYMKKDGQLNAKQVLDALQAKDRKLEKESVRLEAEKAVSLHQQLEVKEAATRQRLMELKQRLRQSSVNSAAMGEMSTPDSHFQPIDRPSTAPSMVAQLNHPTPAVAASGSVCSTGHSIDKHAKTPSENAQNSHLVHIRLNDATQVLDTCHRQANLCSTQENTLHSESPQGNNSINSKTHIHKPKAMSFESDAKSNYQKSDSFVPSFLAKPTPSQAVNLQELLERVRASRARKGVDVDTKWGSTFTLQRHSASADHVVVDVNDSSQDSVGDPKESVQTKEEIILPSASETDMKNTDRICKPYSQVLELKEVLSDKKETLVHIPGESHMISPDTANQVEKLTTEPKRLFRPSEYVYSGHDSNFNAYEMSLKHVSFESTLNSMLGLDKKNLVYSHKHYDKFARTAKGSRSKGSQRSKCKDGSKVMPGQPARPTEGNVWGPEARNMSIEDKLKDFLCKSSDLHLKASENSALYPNKGLEKTQSRASSSVNIQDTPKGGSLLEFDIDDHRPPIRAVPAEVEEDVYMASARQQRERVGRIRAARAAAETIQRAWRKYEAKRTHRQPDGKTKALQTKPPVPVAS